MKLFSENDKLYYLQEAWNELDQEEAITYSHFDLAKQTEYSEEEWRAFLSDGKVSKFLEEEVEMYKQAQMRKLIARATTNDKSVGTAQMLNAIGKSMEDDAVESNFFIYSYVPLNDNEIHAPMVRQENAWQPPSHIIETEDEATQIIEELAKEDAKVETVDIPEPSKEVTEDEFF